MNTRNLTRLGQFRENFWAYFDVHEGSSPKLGRPYAASLVHHPIGQTGLAVSQAICQRGVWFFLVGQRGERDEDVIRRIAPLVEPIKAALGSDLDLPAWAGIRRLKHLNSHDRRNWPEIVEWFNDHRNMYERVVLENRRRRLP